MGQHSTRDRGRGAGDSSGRDPDDALRLDAMRLTLVAGATENVTHEMNNVLMSIANYVEIAAMPHVTPPQREAHLARVSDLVDEAAELVRVLRSVSVDACGEAATIDLAVLVRRAVAATRAALRHSGVSVALHVSDTPLQVVAPESDVLHAVLGHLVAVPAAIATPPRAGVRPPKLVVTAGRTDDGLAEVCARVESDAPLDVLRSRWETEPNRWLAVRTGATVSIDADGDAGSVCVVLRWPLAAPRETVP